VTVALKQVQMTESGNTKVWLLVKAIDPVVYSLDVWLAYDGTATGLAGLQTGPLAETMIVASNTNEVGTIRSAMAGATPLQGVGALLVFTIPAGQSSNARIVQATINEGQVPVTVDPTGAVFDQDTDGDGQSDLNEVLAGTEPLSLESVFAIRSVTRSADGSVTVAWSSVTGKRYQLEYKDTVEDKGWKQAGAEVVASGLSASGMDDTAGVAVRLYRVRLVE
jgi:hypothetical protein